MSTIPKIDYKSLDPEKRYKFAKDILEAIRLIKADPDRAAAFQELVAKNEQA